MEAVTCGNLFILTMWMVFVSYSCEGLMQYKQSKLHMQRFRSSEYTKVHLSQKLTESKDEVEAAANFAVAY